MSRRIALLLGMLALPAFAPAPALAQGQFFPLVVHGSSNLSVAYNNGYLTVQFRRTRTRAGSCLDYRTNVPPGSAAWLDRPLNNQEPVMLRQKMSNQQAGEAINRLRDGGYWKFYCRFTGQRYFEASRSEPASECATL